MWIYEDVVAYLKYDTGIFGEYEENHGDNWRQTEILTMSNTI